MKGTELVAQDNEEKLWSTGVLSVSMPKGLLYAVFFLNGKILPYMVEMNTVALRSLKLYATFHLKVKYVTHTQKIAQRIAGGFNQLSVPNKVVHQYQDFEASERCYVNILDKYLHVSKQPPNARDMDIFYLCSVASAPTDHISLWYVSTAIGKNPLSQMMKTTREAAEIPGNKTNHSLRAYAASELFYAGILEKVIQDRTGHRSLDGGL